MSQDVFPGEYPVVGDTPGVFVYIPVLLYPVPDRFWSRKRDSRRRNTPTIESEFCQPTQEVDL